MASHRRESGSRALEGVHEAFLAAPDAPLPLAVREVVAQSWRRSLRLGVDPGGNAPIELSEDALAEYRAGHPLAAMMPLVRNLLAEDAEEAGHIVAVGDAVGRLLWVEGHHGLRTRAEGMHFVEGALWSERGAGTNAPGTALALGQAVQIAASEHFGVGVHPWSCVAAPIRDPLTGTVLGVVDLTGGDDVAGPRSLALVRACAAAMESQLLATARSEAAERERSAARLVAAPRASQPTRPGRPGRPRSAGSASENAEGRLEVLGAETGVLRLRDRELTLSRRHTEIMWVLAANPSGVSAEQLESALHHHGSHLVTVRAEIVRLRRAIADHLADEPADEQAADVVASRPYRLTVSVETDVDDVRRMLARGAVHKALDLFVGPPLPGSDAPALVAVRDELVAELREAVLRSRSTSALERWTATPSGHDDARAWRLLDECLPYGSPKRATAKAHVARLAG